MKHGSDSGIYDKQGRFVPQMFEDMFSQWDVHGSGSLSAGEMWQMIKGNRLAADPFGVRRMVVQLCGFTNSHSPVGCRHLRVWHDVASAAEGWASLQRGSSSDIRREFTSLETQARCIALQQSC